MVLSKGGELIFLVAADCIRLLLVTTNIFMALGAGYR